MASIHVLGMLVSCGIVAGRQNINTDEFLQTLEGYEIIIPSRVTRDGRHVSYNLHPVHSMRRRSVDSHVQLDDTIHYSIDINNKNHILILKHNRKLISPGLVIERKQNRFKNVTDSRFSTLNGSKAVCHYHGDIENQRGSKVAVALCNGMQGFIHTADGEYFIEPLNSDALTSGGQHRHVIYKRTSLPAHLDPLRIAAHTQSRGTSEDNSCGVKEFIIAHEQRDRWEKHHRRRNNSAAHHRSKRSFSTERYIETLIVVDPSMIKYHKNEHLETYVLTIMNMVAAMFHDASIGNSINIVLVRIILMEEDQDELVITHHADKTLKSFCKFQKHINFKDDDHPNHHDVAILLTRKNICSRLNEPCGTLGLAQVSGMCQPHRSCSISEDTGLALAYTVTHELGHNFGMHHDGSSNGCEDPPGKQLYIMSPSLVADSLTKSWSNCSNQAITQFIDRDWGYCLDDEPSNDPYNYPVLPPGTMYDADHQCRLQYGTDDAEICTNEQDVCSYLWCRTDNKCSTHLEAAAEGTICGTNKWCFEGMCVKIGDRPDAINGEWGEWTSWTDCTRTCGGGVSHSQRHCENPAPSHGGKYCLGERKRFRICKTEECEDGHVTFNEAQCAEFNYIPYKKRLYEWEHVPTSETPCQLHCKPKNHFFSVLMKDIASDGTPCTPGTRNMCISGRCRHIGCDYVIDSKAREDRCGVCHGDGSTCTTVKSQFNDSHGLGYVEAVVIPVGARNIRIEEVAAASNFLALQNSKGEYYLNGHWFIQWSGDYKAAGTIIQYKREGNKESVISAGPLKEPLHVMLLLQSTNPGVIFEYTVPKNNVTESRQPVFHWTHQPWTHCTSSCGGGSQRSETVCVELEAGIVDDKYCNASAKPDDALRVCNEHLCPARWWTGPWQHCSATCGDKGVHQRTVICVRSLGADEQIALDDVACIADDKPAETESCHKKEPCPGSSMWLVGDWSSCNGNPCGQKYRKVECRDAIIGCEYNIMPASESACRDVPCGDYVTSEWTECTRSCSDGIQTRQVYCGGSDLCDTTKKPETQRHCNIVPCIDLSTTTQSTAKKDNSDELHLSERISDVEIDEKDTGTSDTTLHSEHVDTVSQSEGILEATDVFDTNTKIVAVESSTPNSVHVDYSIEIEDFNDVNIKSDTQDKANSDGETEPDQHIKVDNQHITTTHQHILKSNIESGSLESSEDEKHFAIPETGTTEYPQRHRHTHEGTRSEEDTSVSSDYNPKQEFGIRDHGDEQTILEEKYKTTTVKHREPVGAIGNAITSDATGAGDKEVNASVVITDTIPKPIAIHDVPTLPETKFDLSSLPSITDLSPLPADGKLPSLPNIKDLAPLPKLEELQPIDADDLDKLPDLSKMPSIGNLLPMDINRSLSVTTDDKQPSTSYSRETSSLSDSEVKGNELTKQIEAHDDVDGAESDKMQHSVVATSSVLHEDDSHTKELTTKPPLDKHSNKGDMDEIRNDNTGTSHIHIANMNMHLNESKHGMHNVSMGEGDSLILSEVVGNSPIMQRLDTENKVTDYKWMPLDWSDCSRHCGGGVRTRVVECLNADVDVDPTSCDINTKPTAVEDCNKSQCNEWQTSEWGQCSVPCGRSIKTRLVSCPHSDRCDPKYKPASEETCDVPMCVKWVTGQWSKCTKQCDGGDQLRLVQCVDVTSQRPSRGCDDKEKPREKQQCNDSPCKDNNAALSVRCEHNALASTICRSLRRLDQCQNRIIALKCCKTCSHDAHRRANKHRSKARALR